jgi:hypothetical protein
MDKNKDNTSATKTVDTEKIRARKKAKAAKKALAKAKDKDRKSPKTASGPRVTMDSVTLELVRRPQGVTLDEAASIVAKKFPKHDATTVHNTTARRLKGYLAQKYGIKIARDDNGRYREVVKRKKSA